MLRSAQAKRGGITAQRASPGADTYPIGDVAAIVTSSRLS
jgi:hypothetical protein